MADGTVLIVDDDPDILLAGRMLLRSTFGQILSTGDPSAVPDMVREHRPDVILLDMNFSRGATSGDEGFRLLGEIVAIDPEAVVIVITAHGGINIAVEAMKRGATD
ncbi:MAG: response regulator, partial [Sphingomonadaceae bacterium]|nr:response regulator [Sphingomonadaceae bacterium]